MITKRDALLAEAENIEKPTTFQQRFQYSFLLLVTKLLLLCSLNCSLASWRIFSLAWSYKILTEELFLLWNETPWTICSIYFQFILPGSLKKPSIQIALERRWRISPDNIKEPIIYCRTGCISSWQIFLLKPLIINLYGHNYSQNSWKTCWNVYKGYTILAVLTDVYFFPSYWVVKICICMHKLFQLLWK